MRKITPCLWFDDNIEEAVKFYTSVFTNSKIGKITRYSDVGQEIHGRRTGSVMTIEFELNGQPFLALNGGPVFKFNEAVSFIVYCETQEEVDSMWEKLSEGGQIIECGWLKDRFGLAWQVIPTVLGEMISDPDRAKADRAFGAMLQMKKIEIPKLKRAYEGP